MKPYFKSIRHFIQARKMYLYSIPVRYDAECFSNNIYDHLCRTLEYRTSLGSLKSLGTWVLFKGLIIVFGCVTSPTGQNQFNESFINVMGCHKKSNIYINCKTIVDYYLSDMFPHNIGILILQYSGHLYKGSRSIAWWI